MPLLERSEKRGYIEILEGILGSGAVAHRMPHRLALLGWDTFVAGKEILGGSDYSVVEIVATADIADDTADATPFELAIEQK